MTILLIWNEIPQDLKYVIFEDPSDEEISLLKHAHNHFVNDTNDESALRLMRYLEREKKQMISSSEALSIPVQTVFVSGIVL